MEGKKFAYTLMRKITEREKSYQGQKIPEKVNVAFSNFKAFVARGQNERRVSENWVKKNVLYIWESKKSRTTFISLFHFYLSAIFTPRDMELNKSFSAKMAISGSSYSLPKRGREKTFSPSDQGRSELKLLSKSITCFSFSKKNVTEILKGPWILDTFQRGKKPPTHQIHI